MRGRDDADPGGNDHLPDAGDPSLPVDDGADRPTDGAGDEGTPDEPSIAVSTGIAATIGGTSATLEGSLDVLPGAGVAVGFEYRETGAEEWTPTATETRSTPGTFCRAVEGLSTVADYEFRAVAEAGDARAAGSAASFSTTTDGSTPLVDRFEVTEAGLPNPHAELTVEWSVSDTGGDLSTVLIRVVDDEGWLLDATSADVSGDDDSDVDYFRIPDAADRTMGVKLTVADEDGHATTVSATVAGRSG